MTVTTARCPVTCTAGRAGPSPAEHRPGPPRLLGSRSHGRIRSQIAYLLSHDPLPRASSIAPKSSNISVGPYSSTAVLPVRFGDRGGPAHPLIGTASTFMLCSNAIRWLSQAISGHGACIPELNSLIFLNNPLDFSKRSVSPLSRRRRWDFQPSRGHARALIGGKLTSKNGVLAASLA